MIAFSFTILFIFAGVLASLFYFLNQRLEAMVVRLVKFGEEMETLYANQKVLEADMKKVYNDIQAYKKEIAQIQQRRTEKTHAV